MFRPSLRSNNDTYDRMGRLLGPPWRRRRAGGCMYLEVPHTYFLARTCSRSRYLHHVPVPGPPGPVPEFVTLTLDVDAGFSRVLASLLIRVLLQPASAPLLTLPPANPSTSFLLGPRQPRIPSLVLVLSCSQLLLQPSFLANRLARRISCWRLFFPDFLPGLRATSVLPARRLRSFVCVLLPTHNRKRPSIIHLI